MAGFVYDRQQNVGSLCRGPLVAIDFSAQNTCKPAERRGFDASCFASCRPRLASGSARTASCSTVHWTVSLTLTPSRVRNPAPSEAVPW
jgi:hypothetical protein